MSAQQPYVPVGCSYQGRLTERDLDARIAEKMQPLPAEACTELGADQPRTGRARPFGPIRRALYGRRPTYTCSAVVFLSVVCAFIWVAR